MNKPTRRQFLQWSAAATLVGGVSLLVLQPRGKQCVGAWDCTTCSLDPTRDQSCPKYGEVIVDQKKANPDASATLVEETPHA